MNRRDMARRLAGSLLVLGAWAPQAATAQNNYPSRPIRMLVGFAAGGPTDNAARLIATAMGKQLGQAITVENRPGANALLAATELLRSKPDGYSILLASNGTLSIAPARISKLPYDTKRDFTLVAPVVAYPHVLVVPASYPADDFASFLRVAKERKAKLNGASVGHVNDLTIEWLNKLTGMHATRIPYRGDSAVINDLVTNRLDFALLAPNVAMPLVEGRKLKAIALTSPGGTNALNRLKTIRDSGYPDFDVEIWNCLVAPAGTPPDVVAKLAAALRTAQESPEVQASLAVSGQHVMTGSADKLAQHIDRETLQWKAVAQEAGLPMLEQ